jgi:hypothetical protein
MTGSSQGEDALLLEVVAQQGFSLAHPVAVIPVGGEVGFFGVGVAAI